MLDQHDVIRRYQSGESIDALSRSYRVRSTQVRHVLITAGIPLHPRGSWSHISRIAPSETVVALYRDGLSAETIASELGCATGTIKNRLHRAGVPTRSGMARVERAHAASRGSKRTVEQLARRAKTTQDCLGNQSATERTLLAWLRERRLEVVPQLAVGAYNIDLAAHPVAVEVLGGNWHFARDHRQRLRYLADCGWYPLLLWVDKRQSPLDVRAADQIVALAQLARRDPPAPGQHWVVRGSGEIAAAGSVYAHDFAVVRPRQR